MHKITSIFFIALCVSCQTEKKKEINEQEIKLSNFTLLIPPGCELTEGVELEKGILKCDELPDIKLFNFGKIPVSVESNVMRWESQLDSVIQSKTTWQNNQLVCLTHITGLSQGKTVHVYGTIIPSADGPYYLKTSASNQTNKAIETIITEVSSSIKYE